MARVGNRLTRVRGLDPRAVDLAVAGCLAVLAVALFSATRHPFPAALFGALGATAVATRRRAPRLSIVTLAVSSVLIAVADQGTGQPTQAIVATLCYYTLGTRAGRGIAQLVDVALLAVAAGVVAVSPPQSAVGIAVTWTCCVLLPYIAGRTVASRRALTAELEANAERARREQEARARSAAAEERTRIARELHDVIAHSLSVMVAQADGGAYAFDAAPERSRQALAEIGRTGRQALAEMSSLLGVLRTGPEAAPLAPAPAAAEIAQLVTQAREAGMRVRHTVEGPVRPLPGGLSLTAYRIVQEALTNVRKHASAGAAAEVTLRYDQDELLVRVADDGHGPAGLPRYDAAAAQDPVGHGLAGMRERAAMYGGTVTAGPRAGGGFEVTARLPLEARRGAA